jgi:DNA-directed RNA polymerase
VGFEVQENDRKSFPDRLDWTLTNWDLIERTAKLESDHWLEAKKPFSFYAACVELHAARTQGPDYRTHLPITFDGTCSGLQHLCAMTRDEKGGALVNLRASAIGDGPQDIYEDVAKKVAQLVECDEELRGIAIDRDLVKRPVMTYAYSVTPRGMAAQIKEKLEDGDLVEAIEEELADRGKNLEWRTLLRLAGYVFDAVEVTVPKAAEVREFLRRCAQARAKLEEPLQWTTPTGLPWANRYYRPKTQIISSTLRGRRLRLTIADEFVPGIRNQKAANGVAPNVVHALDAAHLLRTVNACVAADIKDILTIHDCFGCLTPQAEKFNAIMRQEFVRMYEEHDPLTEIRERALCDLGPLAPKLLRPVPERGSLNLSEFLESSYAFC